MKTASIICTIILLGLFSLVLSQPQRKGFVILLDESYRADIVDTGQNDPDDWQFPDEQPYEKFPDNQLRRAVEDEEKFNPQSVFQINEVVYLTDKKNGKLSRFSPREGLQIIAVFGGKLKNLQKTAVDQHGNIYVSIKPASEQQANYLVKLTKTPAKN